MSQTIIETRGLDLFYGDFHALTAIDLEIPEHEVTALIGPSGCGKSTLLRVFNRMNDLIAGVRIAGDVRIFGEPLWKTKKHKLRKRVGMVFQRPNPFPLTVYENIVFGLRVHGEPSRRETDLAVEKTLEAVGLWN